MKNIKSHANASHGFKLLGMLAIILSVAWFIYLDGYQDGKANISPPVPGDAVRDEAPVINAFETEPEPLNYNEKGQTAAVYEDAVLFAGQAKDGPCQAIQRHIASRAAVRKPLDAAPAMVTNQEKKNLDETLQPAAIEKSPETLPPKTTAPFASEHGSRDGQASETEPVYGTILNNYVLDAIKTYPIGEISYPYLLNNDYADYNGVTKNLSYQGKVLLKAHPSGNRASHCMGITFEVFFRAMQARNGKLGICPDDFNGMNWDNLFDMALNWFVASGYKKTNNIVIAVEAYGIGRGIKHLEDVRAGDFIDFNRVNGTGHTVVFIDWIKQADRIVGLRYWSSQGSTGGINYNEEYFSDSGGNVIRSPIYIARILPVKEYSKFRN